MEITRDQLTKSLSSAPTQQAGLPMGVPSMIPMQGAAQQLSGTGSFLSQLDSILKTVTDILNNPLFKQAIASKYPQLSGFIDSLSGNKPTVPLQQSIQPGQAPVSIPKSLTGEIIYEDVLNALELAVKLNPNMPVRELLEKVRKEKAMFINELNRKLDGIRKLNDPTPKPSPEPGPK